MLTGKVAVITGGTRGIGFATAKKFLENKSSVIIFGSKKETVEKAVITLQQMDSTYDVMGFYPELTNMDDLKKVFHIIYEKYGKIDILVNNAGISSRESFYSYTISDFEKIMNLNVNAMFCCSKIAATYMKEKHNGVILNTSSMVSIYGQSTGCGYPTSKFAVNGFTKSLARELGRDGIRVNAVAPGVIETDMTKEVPENLLKPITENIPLRRIGKPEDIANAFLFLASDMASYITGAILSVDGAAMS